MAKSPRKLSFRDRNVWNLEQTVLARFALLDDFTDRFVFPDLTTPVPLVLFLSQQEFTKLYSAVLTGADLTYPEQSHDIEYLYLQMVALPMAQLCTAIADCIDNSSDVSIAINTWLQNNGYGTGGGNPPGPLPPGITGTTLLPEGYSCTNDAAFGMAMAVVTAVHEATEEVLQAIEIHTNPLELAAEMADNIPGASVLTAGVDLAAWIQDTAAEGYDLAWSTVVHDELACMVWCAMLVDCELSFDTLWDIYLEEAGIPAPPENDLNAWVVWLIAIVFTADRQTVATVSLLGLLMMRYGGPFGKFTLGIRTLDMVIKLSEDESDSDWSILCDDCQPDWCIDTDWTLGASGWAKAASEGAGTLGGSGWVHEDIIVGAERRRSVNITKSFTSALVKRIDLLADHTQGFFLDNTTALIFVTEDSSVRTDVLSILRDDMPDGSDLNFVYEDLATGQQMDYIGLFCRSSKDNTAPYVFEGNILFKSVQICGDNPEPGDL
jgi:hypothetical protein